MTAVEEADIAISSRRLNDVGRSWRSGLHNRLRVLVVVLFGLAGVVTYGVAVTPAMQIFSVCLVVVCPILAWLLTTPRIALHVKFLITVGSLVVASCISFLITSFLPGTTLSVALVLILTALLFGRRAFAGMLLFYSLLVVAAVIAIAIGLWDGVDPREIDPTNAAVLLRSGLVAIVLWAGLGISVLYVVNTVEDVSERRRVALEELEEQVAERRVAEGARREAEAMAHQAQKMEAVGQLAAGIAHDVNNALLVVQGWNELRGDLDTSGEQREATEAIEQAALYTAQLTRQLLTFARKDLRRPQYLYLDELVGGMISTLRRLVGSKIELTFDSDDHALVHADEAQLQQLLFNLVINARDALARKGTIKIRIRHATHPETSEYDGDYDGWTVLEIEDNGPGIDEATQQRVFEPFFTTKPSDKGTGLGLATVLGIVHQSHGHIELSSRPGRTRFSIYLPLAHGHVAEPTAGMLDETPVDLGLRILVVEDDPLARQLIVKALRRSGNVVVECASGDDVDVALAADSTPFNLLCSDAVFPDAGLGAVLDSFERHSPDARILICSGYVREELAIRKVETGEYGFLAKPFSGSQLVSAIRDVINRPKSAGPEDPFRPADPP